MGKFEKGKRPTQAQSYAEPQRAPKKKKQKKQSRLGLIVALLAAAVVLVGCGVGYMFLRDDGRIVNNLYVAGVDLSGMTKEEAVQESSRCLRCDHFGYGIFKGGRENRW